MNPEKEKIGVIGFAGPERSQTDIKLQHEFNRLKDPFLVFREPKDPSKELFMYRTEADKCQQRMFNPYYNREDYGNTGNARNSSRK